MTSDPRIDRLEGVVQEMGNRLNSVESRLTNLENTMNSRFNSLESRMSTMWATTIGTMIAGFITIFVAILLKS
jgi:flagellar capping protein FliD